MSTVNEMCSGIEKYNRVFKAKTYADAVEEFYGLYSDIFKGLNDKIEDAAKDVEIKYGEIIEGVFNKEEEKTPLSDEMKEIVGGVATEFIHEISETVRYKGKLPKGRYLMDLNMFIVMYVLPGIIATNREFAYYLAYETGQRWPDTFGGNKLGCADYDTINAGFKRKLCYITTAVCESLGKPDDCEELNMLREFRDGYMKSVDGGNELVQEYYEIAPAIVERINLDSKADEIYADIYEKYIKVCIDLIKRGEQEECLQCYKKMVEDLR